MAARLIFQEGVQHTFQLPEGFFQFQNQGRHFPPVEIEGVGVAEDVAEAEIIQQCTVKLLREQRRTLRRRRLHPQQQVAMPVFSAHRLAVQFDAHAFEDIFYARVKRMKRGRERREFNLGRDGIAALGKKRVDAGQETLQLFAFRRLLLAEFIPRGRVHFPCGDGA